MRTKAQWDAEMVETEAEKEELRKKALAVNAILEKEMEERGSDYTESDESEDEDEKKWDCQTILSTFTNTDNHPGVIKTTRVVKFNQHKLDINKQFKVPLNGLIAEEIDLSNKEKETPSEQQVATEEIESEEGDEADLRKR